MSTAGRPRHNELYAVLAAIITTAVLAALVPQREASAGEPLPPATVPTTDVVVRFSPQVSAADRRATITAAGGTVTRDLRGPGGIGAHMSRAAAEQLRSALGVLRVSPNR